MSAKYRFKLLLTAAAMSCVTLPAFSKAPDRAGGAQYGVYLLAAGTTSGNLQFSNVGGIQATLHDAVTNSNKQSGSGSEMPAWCRPPTVPLPAAAWLFLSGIGALGMFARRRLEATGPHRDLERAEA
jgi:PEP-CTERM motif